MDHKTNFTESIVMDWPSPPFTGLEAFCQILPAPTARSGDEVTLYLISMATEGSSASDLLLLFLPTSQQTEASGFGNTVAMDLCSS